MRLLSYEILRLGVLWRQSKLGYCHIRVSSVYRLSCRSVATGLKKNRTNVMKATDSYLLKSYNLQSTCNLFRLVQGVECLSVYHFSTFYHFFQEKFKSKKFNFLVCDINLSIMNKWYLIKKLCIIRKIPKLSTELIMKKQHAYIIISPSIIF